MRASTSRSHGAADRGVPVRRFLTVATAAVLSVTTLAACHSSASVAAPKPSKGGTLNVILSNQAINHLDPQEISLATDGNISRLINRTLTTVNTAGQLVPDLATDTGRPSDNDQVWEFTLKPNLKWQDGSPVRCEDVKYGIERRFAPVISAANGLPYPLTYLKDNPTPYTGPFAAGAKDLTSINCEDASTIQFKLAQSAGDFGFTVSVNGFAPVNAAADRDHSADGSKTSTNYDPFSNGPYKVDASQTVVATDPQTKLTSATHLVLIRNPYWNPSTDPERKAYPDRMVIDFKSGKPQVTNSLIQSTDPYYKNAISLDGDVPSQFVQQVINDPDLSKRVITGFLGATRYFAINVRKEPNLLCRQALEYGFDKRAWRYEAGGPIFGDLATSIIPPNLLAHEKFDIYNTNQLQDGDSGQAKKLWAQGKCPTVVKVGFPNASGIPQQMSTVVRAYQAAGIEVKLYPLDQSTYFGAITDPREKYDMTYAGWVPDWPNGSAVIPPLFSGKQVANAIKDPSLAGQNLNFSMVQDPALDNQITDAFNDTDLNAQYHLWGELDKYVIKKAYAIPVLFSRSLRLTGTNVRGGAVTPAFGEPDLSVVGLAS